LGSRISGRDTPVEHLLIPFELTVVAGDPVLVLAPHADDETFGCGGAICLHRRRGERVKLVVLTDGAAAEPGYSGAANPDYVEKRREEARAACTHLGVQDIEFWNVPDRTLRPTDGIRQRLVELLNQYRPALVYAPSLHEFHPDHRNAAHLVWGAIAQSKHQCRLLFYEVNRPFKVNTLVDISAVVDVKRKAGSEYRSQLESYDYDDFAASLNRFRALSVSSKAKYVEAFQLVEYAQMASSTPDAWLLEQFFSERRITRPEEDPLVSVVVRTRNRPGLLREALFSVRQQNYANIELVIVNDGGVEIDDIVDEFRSSMSVKYIRNAEPRGRSAAANIGMQNASGKYLNFLDDDDLLYPDHVEKLVAFLENTHEKVAFSECVMGKYKWADGVYRRIAEPELYPSKDFSRDELIRENFIPIMTVMFARACLKDVDGFDERFDHFEDWDFWIRLSRTHHFHKMPGATAEYRILDQKMDVQRQRDTVRWRAAVYAKYPDFWTTERIVEYGWSRILWLEERLIRVERDWKELLMLREEERHKREFARWQDWSRRKMHIVLNSLRRMDGRN
jgi:LmbE family N-acetylglucosaminyl deacetylase/glycosyltransferase involved in cell wall biosynthesis